MHISVISKVMLIVSSMKWLSSMQQCAEHDHLPDADPICPVLQVPPDMSHPSFAFTLGDKS